MVNDIQAKFDVCLEATESKKPEIIPFIDNVSKCSNNVWIFALNPSEAEWNLVQNRFEKVNKNNI